MKTKPFFLYFIIAFFVLPSTSSFAQHEGDVCVSIAAGVSVPLLDYAKTDFDDESSGFARPGGVIQLDFSYQLNDYLSLSGMLTGGMNRFDYVALQDWLTQNFANSLPDTRWVVESKSWGLGGILAGVTGQLPLSRNKIFIEGKLQGGLLYVYSPARYITGTESGEEDIMINTEQYASPSWAVDVGLGMRYFHKRNRYFRLAADYLLAHPYYNGVETTSNIGVAPAESFSQRVSTVNITLGIGYIVN